jgi:hypothetical protein
MHPNAQTVMSAFQAFAEGDMATMEGLFADDAIWHVAGRNKWSGDYTGPQAIVQYMSGVAGSQLRQPTACDPRRRRPRCCVDQHLGQSKRQEPRR